MRLDKFISISAMVTRTEATRLIGSGFVSVEGVRVRNGSMKIDELSSSVELNGKRLKYRPFIYVIMNKPEGFVCATEDQKEKTVLDLLTIDLRKKQLFPVGRLDKNTVGLLLLTNNGQLAHRMLAPRSHVEKIYRFKVKFPLSLQDVDALESGIRLDDGYFTRTAKISLDPSCTDGTISIVEGKFHQIKRMMEAVNNQIVFLERIRFGPLALDPELRRGQWRFLSEQEIDEVELLLKK